MNHRWVPNAWMKLGRASFMWHSHPHKSVASLPLFGTFHCRIHAHQQPVSCHAAYLSLKYFHNPRVRSRKGWILKVYQVKQRLGLHTSSLGLNTSASRWSASLSQHMSRVRSTLDTVTKAVSGTHTELLSKISRLRSNTLKAKKQAEVSVESPQKAEENAVSTTNSPLPSASTAPQLITQSPPACSDFPSSAAALDASATTSTSPNGSIQVTIPAAALTVTEDKNKKLRRVAPAVKASCAKKTEELPALLKDAESKSTTPKEAPALFHPSSLSVNLDDTYTYLAHHINSYFGSSSKTQDKKGDSADPSSSQHEQSSVVTSDRIEAAPSVAPPSSKKSLGQYLSSSAPTVQAFVGNYIAPLVPKFRTGESKSAALEEKKTEDVSGKQLEATVSKEEAAAEEKAKKLLLQREKVGVQHRNDLINRFPFVATFRGSEQILDHPVKDVKCQSSVEGKRETILPMPVYVFIIS